jgi:putative transposase
MQAELEEHLTTEESPQPKERHHQQNHETSAGEFELKTPRDRANTFEPQIVKKHQKHLTDELERKVIALFALGNSYQEIRSHLVLCRTYLCQAAPSMRSQISFCPS